MKKVLLAAAAVMALPAIAEAQDVQNPGVYIGVEGGLNWMFNTTILGTNVSPQTGWALGGKIGYDWLGPRVEVEGLYRQNQTGQFFGNRAINGQISQVSAMANFLYDFNATGTFVPYIGAGAGVMESDDVAQAVIAGMEAETFLILPHAEVAEYTQRKAQDRDRWLGGMRKMLRKLAGQTA